MKTMPLHLSALILSCCVAASAFAEAPRTKLAEPINTIGPRIVDAQQKERSLSTSTLTDWTYDYEVYSAPDVTGETEYVIIARFADTGEWDLAHKFVMYGTADRGFWEADMGVWKFTTEWSARQAAENMIDDGEITDYEIIEQPKEPQWTYEDTFPTRAQAEAFADELEAWSIQLGVPHITKIVPVKVASLSISTTWTLK